MPGNERSRQKAAARKAQRRKEKKKTANRLSRPVGGSLRAATAWPIYECEISRSWREPGELVQILVARSEGSEIAAAGFLVDLGCLGVKDALSHVLYPDEYDTFQDMYTGVQPMMRADLNLAAKVVTEGIAYAARWGFKPPPDYSEASLLLKGADPAACTTPIPLGVAGKPLFIPGPHDNVPRILATLERTAGPGNFTYALPYEDVLDVDQIEDEDAEDETSGDRAESEPLRSSLATFFRRLRPS